MGFASPKVKPEFSGLSVNELCDLEDQGQVVTEGYEFRFEDLPALMRDAEHDLVVYEAVRRLAMLVNCQGVLLPPLLRDWLNDHLDGKALPPKTSGKHKMENFTRDWHICAEIQRFVKKGLKPTRNDETRENNSACDEVASKYRMEYRLVAKIWNNYAHIR